MESPALPADIDPPSPPDDVGRSRPASRDHALSLHRFVGGVQMLGGLTLVSAYALGAPTLDLNVAAAALVVIGAAQLLVGLLWILRTPQVRQLVATRPGTLVAATAVPAIAVAVLGGSSADTAWITSTECWLVATGALLQLRGLLALVAIGTIIVSAIWQLVDGSTGGYGGNGDYLVATVGLAKVLLVGLWIGAAVGGAWRLLGRWYVIERGERGVVRALRDQLLRVDAAAAAVGARLASVPAAAGELRSLRVRLARGIDLPTGGEALSARALLATVAEEYRESEPEAALELTFAPGAAEVAMTPRQASSVGAVLRRQLANIARHAPAAAHVTLGVERAGDDLSFTVVDDGGGSAPADPGAGTAWSGRQAERHGGTVRYFDAPHGVGFELRIPIHAEGTLGVASGLSVSAGLDRFADGIVSALRWAAYIGDTLAATGIDGIGSRWIFMPIAAAVIEYVLWFGVPGLKLGAGGRRIVGAAFAVLLAAGYSIPSGSPDELVPASTSVVVVASLLLSHQTLAWAVLELVRALVVVPLVLRTSASSLELIVIYPLAFNLLVYFLRRFIDRARGLELTTLDAFGRAGLSTATLHGLALRHDVVDVILREAADEPQLHADAADLEAAVDELRDVAAASVDPRAVVQASVRAALEVPVEVEGAAWSRPVGGPRADGAIDRLSLAEVAALAADERASCTPPGLFGHRRLAAVRLRWSERADGAIELRLASEPGLGPPDPVRTAELMAAAAALGVEVHSTPDELELVYPRGR